jgi:hypothetical protein
VSKLFDRKLSSPESWCTPDWARILRVLNILQDCSSLLAKWFNACL